MTPERLRSDLLEIGVTDEAFARFLSEDVSLVRQWLNGDAPIPPWLRMSVRLLQAFIAGVRKGSKSSQKDVVGALMGVAEINDHLDRRNLH